MRLRDRPRLQRPARTAARRRRPLEPEVLGGQQEGELGVVAVRASASASLLSPRASIWPPAASALARSRRGRAVAGSFAARASKVSAAAAASPICSCAVPRARSACGLSTRKSGGVAQGLPGLGDPALELLQRRRGQPALEQGLAVASLGRARSPACRRSSAAAMARVERASGSGPLAGEAGDAPAGERQAGEPTAGVHRARSPGHREPILCRASDRFDAPAPRRR